MSKFTTLDDVLKDSLEKAEARFGPHNKTVEITGIEFYEQKTPELFVHADNKKVTIRLPDYCKSDWEQAVLQLTHEVIHCLGPKQGVKIKMLEEGLAALFSTEYTEELLGKKFPVDPGYLAAYEKVKALLDFDPDIIRRVRTSQGVISEISSYDLFAKNNKIPCNLQYEVTQPF